METNNKVARVVTHETPNGTFYIPERYIYKTRWFKKCGYEWEAFSLRCFKYNGDRYFTPLSDYEKEDNHFAYCGNAEAMCEEWVRVSCSGKEIKVWEAT